MRNHRKGCVDEPERPQVHQDRSRARGDDEVLNELLPVVPDALIQRLTSYITSVRRLKRAIKHEGRYSQYLFLTPQGRPYHDDDGIPSSAIGVAIHRIRTIAQAGDVPIEDFRFHDSRATFACNLLDAAMAIGIPVTSALSIITEFPANQMSGPLSAMSSTRRRDESSASTTTSMGNGSLSSLMRLPEPLIIPRPKTGRSLPWDLSC